MERRTRVGATTRWISHRTTWKRYKPVSKGLIAKIDVIADENEQLAHGLDLTTRGMRFGSRPNPSRKGRPDTRRQVPVEPRLKEDRDFGVFGWGGREY
jgi:hypothetical protein